MGLGNIFDPLSWVRAQEPEAIDRLSTGQLVGRCFQTTNAVLGIMFFLFVHWMEDRNPGWLVLLFFFGLSLVLFWIGMGGVFRGRRRLLVQAPPLHSGPSRES